MTVEPGRAGECGWDACPRLRPQDEFAFVCAGCGGCCHARRDLVLSGYDLYRIARRLDLPPRVVAAAFCREYTGEKTLLPAVRLTPDPKTGSCRFLEGGACLIHPARPLACALYPLGQSIDLATAAVEYYAQTPLCGVHSPGRTLGDYLRDAAVTERTGIDVRWAVVCTRLSAALQAHRGHPHLAAARHRIARALYYDYTLRDEFYPQFQQNVAALEPLLERMLTEN